MNDALVIFDFDGVIADSEVLANTVLAELLCELGRPTTLDQSLERFLGKRLPDIVEAAQADLGHAAPQDFATQLLARTLARFEAELREIDGLRALIAALPNLKRCIASQSARVRLTMSLRKLDLAETFRGAVFSADEVPRGKPFPDLFLHAASRMGVTPSRAIVIEDSTSGIAAARAAGMIAVGFLGGSHIRHGHAGRLQKAGAQHLASSFSELLKVIETWCASV